MGIVANIAAPEVTHFATAPGVVAALARRIGMIQLGLGLSLDLVVEEPLNGLLDGETELLALPGKLTVGEETEKHKGGGLGGEFARIPRTIGILRHRKITEEAVDEGFGLKHTVGADLGAADTGGTAGVDAGHLDGRGRDGNRIDRIGNGRPHWGARRRKHRDGNLKRFYLLLNRLRDNGLGLWVVARAFPKIHSAQRDEANG